MFLHVALCFVAEGAGVEIDLVAEPGEACEEEEQKQDRDEVVHFVDDVAAVAVWGYCRGKGDVRSEIVVWCGSVITNDGRCVVVKAGVG